MNLRTALFRTRDGLQCPDLVPLDTGLNPPHYYERILFPKEVEAWNRGETSLDQIRSMERRIYRLKSREPLIYVEL